MYVTACAFGYCVIEILFYFTDHQGNPCAVAALDNGMTVPIYQSEARLCSH